MASAGRLPQRPASPSTSAARPVTADKAETAAAASTAVDAADETANGSQQQQPHIPGYGWTSR